MGANYKLDYESDLIPVCPNCHAMLHKKVDGEELSLAE
ncbi:MAG: HNH endonuclease, partial [Planctomycetota bacterium]|nr:HNH endonuclease [Planctomycetota bacterium]